MKCHFQERKQQEHKEKNRTEQEGNESNMRGKTGQEFNRKDNIMEQK